MQNVDFSYFKVNCGNLLELQKFDILFVRKTTEISLSSKAN